MEVSGQLHTSASLSTENNNNNNNNNNNVSITLNMQYDITNFLSCFSEV
jgi:hypothetical protein